MKTYTYNVTKNALNTSIKVNDYIEIQNYNSILIQIFSGEKIDKVEAHLLELKTMFPHAIIIGASTDGEIIENNVTLKSTVISISTFDSTNIKILYANSGNDFKNGEILAKELVNNDTKLFISFANGILCNGEEFLNGINSVAPKLMVAGGLSGDNSEFKQCYQIYDDVIVTKGAVAVVLDSKILQVNNFYNFGWLRIGIKHLITSAKLNRIYTIDNLNAIDFYKKYLGIEESKDLSIIGIEFPLIKIDGDFDVARVITNIHDDGSLSFAGNFYENDVVCIGIASSKTILNNIVEELHDKPIESFYIYSCMARRRYLLESVEAEIKYFSAMIPTIGFFGYGEFYTAKKPELLNQTLTAVSLSETNKKNSSYITTQVIQNQPKEQTDLEKIYKSIWYLIEQTDKEYDEISSILAKKIEQEKHYSENILNQFELLLNTMSEGMLLCDEHEKIQDMNLATVKLFGYSKEELKGNSLMDIVDSDFKDKLHTAKTTRLRSEITFIKKDGSSLYTILSTTSININDKIFKMVVIVDLTDIKVKDELLRQHSKLAQMGEMISMIAHQWRQPLNVISAATIKLSMQSELNMLTHKQVQKTTNFIQKATQEMSKTIDDFINFTKPNKTKNLVVVNQLLDEIINLIGTQFSSRDIKITINNQQNLSILTYKDGLSHIIINLLINARDALDDCIEIKKEIIIDVQEDELKYYIIIKDNAGGVPISVIKKIFNPYFTLKEQGKGTGLGLYMSKKILHEHLNGDLYVKNVSDGAVFTIEIKKEGINEI